MTSPATISSSLPPPPKPTAVRLDQIVKDISSVYSVCFNHRDALQIEAKFFYRDFEDRREDFDLGALQKIPQNHQRINQVIEGLRPKWATCDPTISTLSEITKLLQNQLEKEERVKEEHDSERRHREQQDEEERQKIRAQIDKERELIDRAFVERSEQLLHQHEQTISAINSMTLASILPLSSYPTPSAPSPSPSPSPPSPSATLPMPVPYSTSVSSTSTSTTPITSTMPTSPHPRE